jgi:multicomponent Na+:H+ antiporter subunit E
VRTAGAVIGMAVLWLLMSGIYKPLVLFFGAVSVLIAVWVSRRADVVDGQRPELALSPGGALHYLGWLLVEIAKANWAVTRIILSPGMPMRQHLFRTYYTQKTDFGQMIFANSITLTPGTITVEVEEKDFLVHALDYTEADLAALADMGRRVSETETVNA